MLNITHEKTHDALDALTKALEADDKPGILCQLKILSDLGRPQTYASIAATYEFGNIGVKRRDDLAFEWYLKSALEEDDCESYFSVGRFYFHGQHVKKSLQESIRYYQIAYDKGSRIAGIMLASRYLKGEGVCVDLERARQYLQPALIEGYVAAAAFLAKIEFAQKHYFKGFKLWMSCVRDGARLMLRDPHSQKLYGLKSEQMLNSDIANARDESAQWSKEN